MYRQVQLTFILKKTTFKNQLAVLFKKCFPAAFSSPADKSQIPYFVCFIWYYWAQNGETFHENAEQWKITLIKSMKKRAKKAFTIYNIQCLRLWRLMVQKLQRSHRQASWEIYKGLRFYTTYNILHKNQNTVADAGEHLMSKKEETSLHCSVVSLLIYLAHTAHRHIHSCFYKNK